MKLLKIQAGRSFGEAQARNLRSARALINKTCSAASLGRYQSRMFRFRECINLAYS